MRIKIVKLKSVLEGPETHIIYVIDNTDRPIYAELCNENEIPIYIEKFKSKYNIINAEIIHI